MLAVGELVARRADDRVNDVINGKDLCVVVVTLYHEIDVVVDEDLMELPTVPVHHVSPVHDGSPWLLRAYYLRPAHVIQLEANFIWYHSGLG